MIKLNKKHYVIIGSVAVSVVAQMSTVHSWSDLFAYDHIVGMLGALVATGVGLVTRAVHDTDDRHPELVDSNFV